MTTSRLEAFSDGVFAIAFISAPVVLAVHFVIAVYYVVDRLATDSDGAPAAAS